MKRYSVVINGVGFFKRRSRSVVDRTITTWRSNHMVPLYKPLACHPDSKQSHAAWVQVNLQPKFRSKSQTWIPAIYQVVFEFTLIDVPWLTKLVLRLQTSFQGHKVIDDYVCVYQRTPIVSGNLGCWYIAHYAYIKCIISESNDGQHEILWIRGHEYKLLCPWINVELWYTVRCKR